MADLRFNALLFSLLCITSGLVHAQSNSTNTTSIAPKKGNPNAKAFAWKGETWDNDFGAWSSFHVRVGSDEKNTRVFPSTNWQEVLIVNPLACDPEHNGTIDGSCISTRGDPVNVTNSTTWDYQGLFEIALDNDLGFTGSSHYGLDSVALDLDGSGMPPPLKDQVVGAIINPSIPIGIFGLNDGVTNFTNYTDPQPGFLRSLWEQGEAPSKSFGFFAGAIYQAKGVLGRIVFGGYDSNALVPNNITFHQAEDTVDEARHLVLSVHDISVNTSQVFNASSVFPAPVPDPQTSNKKSKTKSKATPAINPLGALPASGIFSPSALDSHFLARVDSSTPFIFLPNATLDRIVKFFGLAFDNETNLHYFPQTALGNKLYAAAQGTTFTFTLADQTNSPIQETVNITLPFQAFDLAASAAIAGKKLLDRRYVPFRSAIDIGSYTLGRSFLQEAYIVADFHRKTFKVHQAAYPIDGSQNIITIRAPEDEYMKAPPAATPHKQGNVEQGEKKSKRISSATLAGAITVGVLGSALVILSILLFLRRQRRLKNLQAELDEKAVPELHGNAEWNEMHGEDALRELEASEAESISRRSKMPAINSEVLELPGESMSSRRSQRSSSRSSSGTRSNTEIEISPEEEGYSRGEEWDDIVSPTQDDGEDGTARRLWDAIDRRTVDLLPPRPVHTEDLTDNEPREEIRPDGSQDTSWFVERPRPARIYTGAQDPDEEQHVSQRIHTRSGSSLSGFSFEVGEEDVEGGRLSSNWRPRGSGHNDWYVPKRNT